MGEITKGQGVSGSGISSSLGGSFGVGRPGVVAGRNFYKFDGVNDYITIPAADLAIGETAEYKFIAPTSIKVSSSFFIDSSHANRLFVVGRPDGKIDFSTPFATVTLDGSTVQSGITSMPVDGLEHVIKVTATTATNVITLAASNDGDESCDFPVYDLDIQAVSGNRFYSVDDGFSVNPVISDKLGSGSTDGTAINFNQSNWSYD